MLAPFFSPHGRSSVPRFLLVLLFSVIVDALAVLLMRDGSVAVVTLAGGLLGATAAKLGTELVRRRHDRSARGWPVLLGLVALALAYISYVAFVLPASLFYIATAVGATALAWIAIAPGDRGDNRFGPPPAKSIASPRAAAAIGGTIVGVTCTIGGALAGFGGATWLDQIARRQAANERWVQQHFHESPFPSDQTGANAASTPEVAP